MRVMLRHTNIPISEPLADHINRKIGQAVRRFQDRIHLALVRITDENGPRGGIDTRCRVIVELSHGGHILVEATAEDAYRAVTQVASRLHRQVGRAISRLKKAPQPFLL